MLRQWRERKLDGRKGARRGRRRARVAGPLTREEMTPYQRWIVAAGRKEPRIPLPAGTTEERVAWMLRMLKDARKA
jgi:hypothetical protein